MKNHNSAPNTPPPPTGERTSTRHPGLQFGAKVAIKAAMSGMGEKFSSAPQETSVDYAVRSTEIAKSTTSSTPNGLFRKKTNARELQDPKQTERIQAITIPDGYTRDPESGALFSDDGEHMIQTPQSRAFYGKQNQERTTQAEAMSNKPVVEVPAGNLFGKQLAERDRQLRADEQIKLFQEDSDRAGLEASKLIAGLEDKERSDLVWSVNSEFNAFDASQKHHREMEERNKLSYEQNLTTKARELHTGYRSARVRQRDADRKIARLKNQ